MQIGSGDVFVRRSGDTMVGPLVINTDTSPAITVNTPGGGGTVALRATRVGTAGFDIRLGVADPQLNITDHSAVSRLTLDMVTGVIGTAIAPLAVIGDSGSIAINGVAAGATGVTFISPTGFTAKTAVLWTIRNSVSSVNNGTGFTGPINQTDFRSMSASINSDATTSYLGIGAGAGQSQVGGKNTNAGLANLTCEWMAIGR